MRRRQVEFVELELHDFRCFKGVQRFQFEPPTADGRSGVTCVTGWGARGKTAFVDALELALWGVRQQRKSPRPYCYVASRLNYNPLGEPKVFIHCDVLQKPDPRAAAVLALRVTEPDGAQRALEIRRSWSLVRDGLVKESLEADERRAGRVERLVAGPAQWRINGVLPPGRPPLVFVDCDQMEILSRLSSIRHDVRESAEAMIAAMVGEWPEEMWRTAAAPVIEAANRLLLGYRRAAEVWLLPEQAGRRWRGAYPIAPGIWAADRDIDYAQLTCIGLALVLGPHLAGETSAPLVLDGPANRLHPDSVGAFLEVLANAVVPQVIIANHAERLEYPALTLLDRLRWIQLVQSDTHFGVDTLDEKALTGTLR